MITSYVDESPTKKVFTFEVPVDDVRRATDRTVKALAKQVRLPGFQPGKVPPEMIKKRFAEEVKGEVLEHLIQAIGRRSAEGEAPRAARAAEDRRPEIRVRGAAFFRVDLEVRPAVEPKDYRGLKVPAGNAVPSDAEIDALIGRIREGHATYEPIEGRAAKDGDFALVDIKGSFRRADGKDFEAEKTIVEVGGEHTMPRAFRARA